MSSIFPVGVVIPNWNLREDTIACVRSVEAAGSGLATRVVVVDNGSSDGSPAALAEAFGARVDQVLMGRNAGFASAVNAGMHYAFERGAASALVLNNDTLVDGNLLAVLGQAGVTFDDAGILCPLIFQMSPAGRIWRIGDRDSCWLPIPLRIPDREANKPVLEMDYGTGCGMLVRREVVEAIGYLDEAFFMYYEDADFCARARKRGIRILCIPAATMWHMVSASSRENGAAQVYWRARGQALFYRKHARHGLRRLAHVYVAGKTAVAWARFVIRGRQSQALSLLSGYRDGYRAPVGQSRRDG
ncbi:MAG: glycosyltransferase family 2 protein [Chloroflexota bacterium]